MFVYVNVCLLNLLYLQKEKNNSKQTKRKVEMNVAIRFDGVKQCTSALNDRRYEGMQVHGY